jgi:hypothetical protein
MDQPSLALVSTPNKPRRGRPPGARNRRSLDLARYVEAQFGGMTPGQQSAQLALVTPAEVKSARARGLELQALGQLKLGFDPRRADPLMLAMVLKAHDLAAALGCERRDAWLLLAKEREALMPYVHQRQATAEPKGQDDRVVAFILADPQDQAEPAALARDEDAIEILGHS